MTLENMSEFRRAGVCGFGIGSNLLRKDLIENERFSELTELARQYVSKAKEA